MIKVKKIKPMFTALVTTAECYEEDVKSKSGLIDTRKSRGTMKEYQRVVAIGDQVHSVKVGDLVSINPSRFAVRKNPENSIKNDIEGGNPILSYRFDQIVIDGIPHLLLQDRDIEFIIEEFDEVPDTESPLIHPSNDIIV